MMLGLSSMDWLEVLCWVALCMSVITAGVTIILIRREPPKIEPTGQELFDQLIKGHEGPMYREKWDALFKQAYDLGKTAR